MSELPDSNAERVLVLAPTAADAALTDTTAARIGPAHGA